MSDPLLTQARALLSDGDPVGAWRRLARLATDTRDIATWLAADRLLSRMSQTSTQEPLTLVGNEPPARGARRRLRVAVLSSHTSGQLTAALRVAAAAHGLDLVTAESGYRCFEQDILDSSSWLSTFAPDVVVLVPDQREVRLAEVGEDPAAELAVELQRWRGLWQRLRDRTGSVVVQTSFVPPAVDSLGNHGASHPGGRRHQLRRLNLELAVQAPPGVHLVDAEMVAFRTGSPAWTDERYWYLSKHAVGLAALPALATAVMDVVAAAIGLARKLVVVDLDNTLWGGVIGEDGLAGIVLGGGPAGEAFQDLQDFLIALKTRGLVLAVCSKNNPDEARLPFEAHPDMRLTLADFVAFEASWDPKPEVIARLAASLDLGLESVVFVDDNPAEREAVRVALPQVGVVELPDDPQLFRAALADFPGLQTVGITAEDSRRTQAYLARGQAREAAGQAGSREDFLASLQMRGTIEPLLDTNLARVVQLVGKTNQFNLTGRRHGTEAVQRFDADDRSVVWAVRLRDRFDDHGLVGVLIAVPHKEDRELLEIDTMVLSCRVLGRTAELSLLAALRQWALDRGFREIVGHFVPSGRNAPAAGALSEAGFKRTSHPEWVAGSGGPDQSLGSPAPAEVWRLSLDDASVRDPGFVRLDVLQLHT